MSLESRRGFLGKSAVLSGVAALSAARANDAAALPQMRLGKYSLSRLIAGNNMFGGGSHSSVFLNRHLKQYYTTDRILQTVRRCHEVGINCWQSGAGSGPMYLRLADEGLKVYPLAIESGGQSRIQSCVKSGFIGIAHHGEVSDRLFKDGKVDQMNDFLKRVRDSGLLVGVSTHMPAVVDTVESKGWDVDYYMTCVYERHRNAAQLKSLLGYVPLPVGEVYLQEDPPRMFKMIRQTKRPCLAFKILAAGRVCDKPETVEAAFRDTFANIKPIDGVIVGMYDEFSDQPLEDANLVRKYGTVAG